MHDRIPHALAWLVRQRRVVAGRLELAKQIAQEHGEQFATAEAAIREHRQRAEHSELCLRNTEIEMTVLARDLAALDQTLRLHEIPIDPEKLGATRARRNPCLSGRGAIKRSICAALAEATPHALNTDEVVAFVIAHCDFESRPEDYCDIRLNIRKRLQRLAREGDVVRLHPRYGGGNKVGLWCRPTLVAQLDDGAITRSVAPHPLDGG